MLMAIVVLLFVSCSAKKDSLSPLPSKTETVKPTFYSLIQGGQINKLKKGSQSLKVSKDEFQLQFPLQKYNPDLELFYAVKIALSTSSLEEATLGFDSRSSLTLGPASGLATAGLYETFYITEGNHYIMFYPEKLERCTKIKDINESTILGSINVKQINFKEKDYLLNELPLEQLYVTIFNDENLNNFIDDGELYEVLLNFK
jgi:hypothetical protein